MAFLIGMPELPEVETIRRELVKVLLGKKITNVEVVHKKAIKSNLLSFKKDLLGKKIIGIDRIGKLLIIDIGQGKFLLIHLKMTGQLIYKHKDTIIEGGHSLTAAKTSEFPPKYSWVVWTFSDGAKLYFSDMRQFGYLKIVDAKTKDKIVSTYGPEPLTKDFTLDKFVQILQKRKAPIKSLLLNQNLIAGIGNIYADEACFAAQVFPGKKTHTLTSEEIKKLFSAINTVLKKAIKYKGTTFKSYRSLHGKKGNFFDYLQVYQRDGKKCFRCQVGIIGNKKIGGRSSRYCLVCQKVIH